MLSLLAMAIPSKSSKVLETMTLISLSGVVSSPFAKLSTLRLYQISLELFGFFDEYEYTESLPHIFVRE